MIKYQNRIIYGADMVITNETNDNPDELMKMTHELWLNDWIFLTTDKEMFVDEVNGKFNGLKLPKTVIDKIYCKNVERMFPGI